MRINATSQSSGHEGSLLESLWLRELALPWACLVGIYGEYRACGLEYFRIGPRLWGDTWLCDMKTASIRQVRHDLNTVLDWTDAGEQVEISKRGKVAE